MPRNCYIYLTSPLVTSVGDNAENIRFSLLRILQSSENKMGPSVQMVLSVVAAFFLTTGLCFKLRCYQCIDNNYSMNSTDSCYNPGPNVTSIECPTHDPRTMCLSIITYPKGRNKPSVYRGCIISFNTSIHCLDVPFFGDPSRQCQCNTDYCIGDFDVRTPPSGADPAEQFLW